jgi:hypothetical protein
LFAAKHEIMDAAARFHARKTDIFPRSRIHASEREIVHRISILAAGSAAAALVLMAPLTASAAPAADVTPALATCSTGFVGANYGADVYSGPDSFRVVDTVTAGFAYPCAELDLGRRYTACGESDGNGWIELEGNNGNIGWSPQACFVDVS